MNIYTFYKKIKTYKKVIFGFFVVVIIFVFLSFFNLTFAPLLKSEKTVNIPKGYSIVKTSQLLKGEGIIRSAFLARIYMQYKNISPKSGPYFFKKPEDMFSVIKRISQSDYGDVYISITIPEGSTNKQLISAIKRSKITVDEKKLSHLVDGKEGYLFPDTYSFLPDTTESDIIQKLEKTFLEKIKKAEKGKTIEKTRREIVIMASILEKEAGNNLKEKQIISGILWKRISKGMLLQVDAPFLYERGKGSAQLSNNDLQKNSVYNTYTNKGLTPTPIGNPGYDSLYAAAHPISSSYLFYLHGDDGKIHYGKNYNEHLKNKRLYLK